MWGKIVSSLKWVFNFIGGNVAILIAISALYLTIYQTIKIQEHYRLSVKPFLSFKTHFNRDSINKVPRFLPGICVKNNGLGPAIIISYQVLDKNKKWVQGSKNVQKLFNEYFPGKISIYTTTINKTGALFNGDHFCPLLLEEIGKTKQDIALLSSFIKTGNIRVFYKSIYEDEMFLLKLNDN